MMAIDLSSSEVTSKSSARDAVRAFAVTLCLTLTLLALGAGYGKYRFGSVSAALAYLRGERLLVAKPTKSVSAIAGDRIALQYLLTNWTDHPISLIGAASSCTCTALESMPITLSAFESRLVSANVTIEPGKPDFSGSIHLFTEGLQSREVVLSYAVRVRSPRSPGEHRTE